MLPGVQGMWGNEPSHSQVNSHCGSWSPKWIPKFLKCDCRGQNPYVARVLYIIGKLLKRRCIKWACITHLDIWNISYSQKKARESNWQFDSWPLKVGNRLNFVALRQRATYCWKALDEGYNFALDLIAIRGLHVKFWAPQNHESPNCGNFGTLVCASQDERPFGCGPRGVLQKIL
jgi:hypothetical protein